ncbi:MAG TPA: trypsin-like peptidase domain-containing protein [Ktedonobacteraceae bacterium]
MGLEMVIGLAPVAYASQPGGDVSDPAIKGVDIAKPAVVRIITEVDGQLTVTVSGKDVTFPLTPQQGVNGYRLGLSGTGAFISTHGDVLTADHVINPVQDDKQTMDQYLDQTAAPDIAAYINQHSQQQVTADQVTQELVSGQLPSTPNYQKPKSQVLLSTDYSGPLSGTTLQDVPPSQFANVDQIKANSPTSQSDTAIIHVNGMDDMPMLQLGDSSAVQVQDQLRIIGFPGNGDVNTAPNDLLTSSVNLINVSSIKTTPSGAPLIQVGGNVEHGDSGGPALDSSGNVVGIVSFGASTGSTSFLQASSSAKKLLQQAGVDTTPSAFQKAWSQAFNDYASKAPGHWHQSTREFQQLSGRFPQFKAISPFLQYASQQAQTEKQTQINGTPTATTGSTPATSSSSGINPVYLVIGGLVVLVIIVFGSAAAISRRRKPAQPDLPATPQAGYGAPVAPGAPTMPGPAAPYFGTPRQGAPVPQTPAYPGQSAYPQQAQAPAQVQPPGYRPAPVPQQGFRSQAPAQHGMGGSMAAFGAPPSTPQPSASDATLVARPASSAVQWRIWPCGHTNRSDASFCGTCGESAPPAPIVRRIEP